MTNRSWTFTTGPAPTVTRTAGHERDGWSATGNVAAVFSEAVTASAGRR